MFTMPFKARSVWKTGPGEGVFAFGVLDTILDLRGFKHRIRGTLMATHNTFLLTKSQIETEQGTATVITEVKRFGQRLSPIEGPGRIEIRESAAHILMQVPHGIEIDFHLVDETGRTSQAPQTFSRSRAVALKGVATG